jgi:hypothetical protein
VFALHGNKEQRELAASYGKRRSKRRRASPNLFVQQLLQTVDSRQHTTAKDEHNTQGVEREMEKIKAP